MHHTDPAKLSIGKALGRVPSGIFILTAKHNGRSTAMLASWVQQAGFDPPAVSIAIAKERSIAELIRISRRLALSIVPKEDTSLMKRYARGVNDDEDAFAGARMMYAPSGLPVFADSLGFLDCRLIQTFDFGGDHEIFIAEVMAADLLRDGQAFAHQRGNGFHY